MPSRTTTQDPQSAYLTTSLTSLSRSRSTNSLVVRSYKQATQYYLTRRFREAWETLLPMIASAPENGIEDGRNGGVEEEGGSAAPVAQSPRSTRVKVWVFYLSLIHAIAELGSEEGAREFGEREVWKRIVGKAREGGVWEEVVREGYAGVEGEVDAEVVVNLATLLLGHMADQRLNREKLESWLGAQGEEGGMGDGGVATPMSVQSAGNPRVLQARVKVLELFVLHVLPERGEWGYARSCVEGSGVLDEERREGFLGALEGLREEREGVLRREGELAERREGERVEEEARRVEEERRRVEEVRREEQKAREARAASEQAGTVNANGRPKRASFNPSTANDNTNDSPARQPPRSARKPPPKTPPPQTLLARLSLLLQSTRSTLLQPRLLLFLLAFVLLAAKRNLRLRLRRILADSWDKVRRTVGMGVKVSYV